MIATLDANDIVGDLTISVRITGSRRFAFRCWIAGQLLALASFVLGSKLEAEAELS